MKIALFSLLLFGLNPQTTTVYICNSGTATSYHLRKDCRGFNACKHEIKEITLSAAKNEGKKLCGWED